MSRIIWKGAISFGLVNIPVALKAASRSHTLDLDLLDQRDMAPVGYQRINKHTGKVIDNEHIVKGYQYEKDEYVLLSDEDFRQANVEATQTVDIVSFVEADSIPPYYFDTPYYLEPDKRGERGYALLHETMRKHRPRRAGAGGAAQPPAPGGAAGGGQGAGTEHHALCGRGSADRGSQPAFRWKGKGRQPTRGGHGHQAGGGHERGLEASSSTATPIATTCWRASTPRSRPARRTC